MTVPKKQSTAAKKARAVQRQAGGKYTALLVEHTVCGQPLDPWGELPGTCARAPHPDDEPHYCDGAAWRQRAADTRRAEEDRRAALTPRQRAEEDGQAWEQEREEMRAAADDDFDPYAKDYGDQD